MASKRRLFMLRLGIILAVLGGGLGVYSPLSAQEETPPPPPLPTVMVEISPTIEPSPTALPSETPTTEPTATDALPTATATLEPTAAPPTETPSPEPTAEFTVEPTLEPTLGVETATPESTLYPEATDEATAEVTPDFITATPEFFATDEATPSGLDSGERHRGTRVESQLLELQSLVEEGQTAQALSFAAATQLDVSPSIQTVHVEVVAADAAEALRMRPAIERLGGAYLIGYERRMEFEFPITALDTLDRTSSNFGVMRPREATPLLGARTSEGVQATGAAQWHQRGIDGAGVRIGVIDLGFSGYAGAETSGCVQAVSNFAAGTTLTSGGTHGANVAQIICDMAPKAQVFLAQVSTLSSLNAAVDWLIAQNVHVVNMSLGWDFAGVGDGTGEVNTIVNRLAQNGILLFNAAGNENNSVWHGPYTNINWTDGDDFNGDFLNFGAPSPNQPINQLFGGLPLSTDNFGCRPGQTKDINITLRWADWNANRTGNATGQDFELDLYFSLDGTTWFFDSTSNLDQGISSVTPVEGLTGTVACYSGSTALRWGVAVRCFDVFNPCGAPYMQLIVTRGGILSQRSPGSSLTSPADSQNVVAVAAAEMKPMNGFPFSPFGYPDLAVYSSRGPILGPGGTAPGSPLYTKPDLTAPTNTTTSLDASFNGTSAASPHAAGFAALVYQVNRATYDAQVGINRVNALRADLLDVGGGDFIRPAPTSSARPGCPSVDCFGQGIITLDNDFFAFTDARMEHTDGRVLRTGANWTQQAQSGASGGTYAYTRDFLLPPIDSINASNYAQIEFGVQFATRVRVYYYRRPDLTGCVRVLFNGVDITGSVEFFTDLNNTLTATAPTQVWLELPTTNYTALDEITIQPDCTANGLTFDYVQLLHGDPIDTFQEDALSTFGTWRRTALANTSGGFHATNNQRGAGVQFYTDAAAFTITYTRQPNGGIMEIWVNGQLCTACGEVNTWSGSTMTSPQAVHFVNSGALTPTFGPPPYFVQLVNSGRQTPATTNRPYITIDNIRFPFGGTLMTLPDTQFEEAETGYTGQANSQFLPMNGVWRNTVQRSAFGGRIFNTTTAGAEFRFRTLATRNVIYFTGLNTGALLEIYVDGQLCAACGRIDTYRSTTMYQIPYYFTIPTPGFTSPYNVTLRNSGSRSSGSGTTMTMAIDRIEALNAVLEPLDLYNVQGNDSGFFWINERWVASRQTDAIGTDVYLNNNPYGGIFFLTCSRNFTLLLGKNRDGGIVRVKLWDDRNANPALRSYITLAEFNGQSTSTTWRNGLNITIPTTVLPSCPYTNGDLNTNTPFQILIEVDSNTQFGNRLDYGYVDALLINDGGELRNWGSTPQPNGIMYSNGSVNGDVNLLEIGPGWQNVPDNTGTFAGEQTPNAQFARRTNQTTGASIQFTILEDSDPNPDENPSPRLIFTRAPDGGIGEVFVNGVFQYEISFYSPVLLKQQFLPLTLPANVQYPAVVELRNVPRRTPGATGNYMYIDAIVETNEPDGFAAPIINNPVANPNNRQNDSPDIQLFGATWTRSANPPTTTVFPSGSPANIDTTTANTGGLRFILSGTNRFTFVSSVSANRGIAEIWVNGRRCTACGAINTFRAQTFWRTPFLVEIPIATFGAGPYYVQIHTTNMRSTGATGFGLSVDEIVPLNGTIVAPDPINPDPWDAFRDHDGLGAPGYDGTWTTINTAFAYNGSYRQTTSNGSEYGFVLQPANNELVVLRTMGTAGGIAQIEIFDPAIGETRVCFVCGTINSYAPYTRYQVPFYFRIPTNLVNDGDNFGGGPWTVFIVNTSVMPVGSRGNQLSLDAFIVLP